LGKCTKHKITERGAMNKSKFWIRVIAVLLAVLIWFLLLLPVGVRIVFA
jgi:uncharacterized RDD family membrane protein YckC